MGRRSLESPGGENWGKKAERGSQKTNVGTEGVWGKGKKLSMGGTASREKFEESLCITSTGKGKGIESQKKKDYMKRRDTRQNLPSEKKTKKKKKCPGEVS